MKIVPGPDEFAFVAARVVDPSPVRPYLGLPKRLFDLMLAVVLLPSVLPVVIFLAMVVRRDGGPAFFAQARVGRGGRLFRCWKIRTMATDAEERLRQLCAGDPEVAREWHEHHKLRHDPRITRIGQFLRRTSLDELPQLFNILKGEMSFVGPRPVTLAELDRYGDHLVHYLSVRPGLTGLWQVSGRNDVSYAARVRLDVEYCTRASLPLDMGIITRTGLMVLRMTGR